MPTGQTVTKEVLLQRLKEQDEAYKQKRLDILQRVKSLEARKKFVGELKAWLVRRKLTNTDLLAMYRDLQPKRSGEAVRSKKPLQPGGEAPTSSVLLVAEMRKQQMIEVDADGLKKLMVRLGFAATSYHHFASKAIKEGYLRKGGSSGNGFMYVLTGGPKTPPVARAPRTTPNKPGDPVFAAAIRKARIDKGWDTTQMGKKVDVSGASISNWETGRYTPTEASRQKLVKLLGLPDDLGAEAGRVAHARIGEAHRIKPATNGAAPANA